MGTDDFMAIEEPADNRNQETQMEWSMYLHDIQALPVTNDVGIQCNMKVEKHNIEVQCDLLSSQDVECCDLSSADDDIDSNGSCMSQEESQMDKSYEETVTDLSDNEDDYEDKRC